MSGDTADDGVVLLVTNEFLDDPRVFRSATAIAEHGHTTSVVCFVDGSARPEFENCRSVRVHRIPHSSGLFRRLRSDIGSRGTVAQAGIDPFPLTKGGRDTISTSASQTRVPLRTQILESAIFLNNNVRWFLKILRLHPSAVYANDLDTLLTGSLLSIVRGVPLIYDSHELFLEMFDPPRPLFTRMLSLLESYLIRRAKRVITVNPSIARELSERYGIGMPIVIFNCPVSVENGRSYTKTDEEVRVIYHGGYAPDRGIEELLEASKYLEKGHLFIRGLISPPLHIQQALAANGSGPDVSFRATTLPRVPMTELVESLRGFDIGVIPYKATCLNNYYSSPNKLFEYMMGGLAIAAADLPEIRRVLEEYENGVLFDPSDPADIAEKINGLTSDRARLDGMKRNSLRGAADRYNWEVQRPRLLKEVDGCLGRARYSE